MTFGEAIKNMQDGRRVTRTGWNGKNMFVVLMPELNCRTYFAMFNARKEWQPGWLSSQEDMLALDWEIVPG